MNESMQADGFGRGVRRTILAALVAIPAIFAWHHGAATELCHAGGIGGTGAAVTHGGIGGTGTPVATPEHGGIGGTGSPMQGAAANLAGRIVFVKGEARAESAEAPPRQLARGDEVCARDLLATAAGAFVQIAMSDGGTLILRENSALKIESFVYNGNEDGSERSEFDLLHGGFRAITGAIGHTRKEAYVIRTPNATISIRGTDHETLYIPPPLSGETLPAEPGTYNRVLAGGTTLQSASGAVPINPGQTGFAPLGSAAPGILPATPGFIGDPLPKLGVQGRRGAPAGKPAGGDSPAPAVGSKPPTVPVSTAPESRNSPVAAVEQSPAISGIAATADGTLSAPDAAGPTETIQPVTGTNGVSLANGTSDVPLANGSGGILPSSLTAAPNATAYVGVHMTQETVALGSLVSDGSSSQVILDANGNPYHVMDTGSGFNYHALNGPVLADYGTATVDGASVSWGIYAGGVAYDETGAAVPVDFHHFAFAPGGATPPDVIANLSGTADFSTIVGFTRPISEQGVLGGAVNTMSVNVLFGSAPAITGYNIDVTDAHARQWNGSFSGNVSLGSFASGGVPLAVTCSGAGCGSGNGAGAAGGQLIGSSAKGMITGYGMGTTTSQAVSGIVILSRP